MQMQTNHINNVSIVRTPNSLKSISTNLKNFHLPSRPFPPPPSPPIHLPTQKTTPRGKILCRSEKIFPTDGRTTQVK